MHRIYLSGPITGAPDYKQRFQEAEEELKAAGYRVINPANLGIEGLSWQEYMEVDMTLLDMCDTIVMLEGWERSKGACIERDYAVKKQYKVYNSLNEVLGDDMSEK